MTSNVAGSENQGTTCTCCSLLCDREIVRSPCQLQKDKVSLIANRVKRDPLVNGKAVAWDDAIDEAVKWIRNSRFPQVTGSINDVSTARAAIEFARQSSATIDLFNSDAAFEYFGAIQRQGLIQTTFNEVRDRCDLLILVGNDRMLEDFPLLAERLARRDGERRVLLIGPWSEHARVLFASEGREAITIASDIRYLPLSLLGLEQHFSKGTHRGSESLLRNNELTVVVWSHQSPPVQTGMEHWILRLHDWMLQRSTRSKIAALPLFGSSTNFHQTCTWLSGFPGRVRWRDGQVHYDPVRYRAHNLLHGSDTDLIIWIGADDEPLPDFDLKKPVISLSHFPLDHDAIKTGNLTSIWFPLPVAGQDFSSSFFRADQGTVAFCRAKRSPEIIHPLRRLQDAMELNTNLSIAKLNKPRDEV